MGTSDPVAIGTPPLQSGRGPFPPKGFIVDGRWHGQENCTPQKWSPFASMLLTAVILLQCPPAASTGAPPATNPPVIVPPTLQPPATTPAPSTSTAPLSIPPTPAGRGDNLTLTQTQVCSWSHWSLIHLRPFFIHVLCLLRPTFLRQSWSLNCPPLGIMLAPTTTTPAPNTNTAALSVPPATPGQSDNLTLTQAQEPS